MPAALTFDSLLKDLRAYLERGTLSDPQVYEQLPRLVNLAERRIATELKIQGLVAVVNGKLQRGNPVLQKPDRWKQTISFTIGVGSTQSSRKALLLRSYEYLRAYSPDDSLTGEPVFFADYDFNHWIVGPSPDAEYPIEVVYYEQPALLDEKHQENWLTRKAPNLLLYASLLECAPFLKDDGRIPTWQQFYDRAAQAFSGEDISKLVDRTAQRSKSS